MHHMDMTGDEWAHHLEQSLRFDSAMVFGRKDGELQTWVWVDHNRSDTHVLPALYQRVPDAPTLITPAFVPIGPGFFDIHCEMLPPGPDISYSLVIPAIADNVPILFQIAQSGAVVVVLEPAPDWDAWRSQHHLDDDEAFVEAVIQTYQDRGFVVVLEPSHQQWLLDKLLRG
jgi:hypothetical protein